MGKGEASAFGESIWAGGLAWLAVLVLCHHRPLDLHFFAALLPLNKLPNEWLKSGLMKA